MYTRAQKESSSISPTSIHKKSNSSDGERSFSVQRQPEINSSQEKDIPSYSRNAADLLAAKVMRSMAARQQGVEAQGTASVTEVVMPSPELPLAPVASVFQPLGEMGKQMQCSACEQAMEDGKDSDEMSSVAGVQRQLTVGAPGDKYEQEADQVAAQVMRMSVAPSSSPQVQRFGEEDNPVQMWSKAQSITPVVHRQVDEQVQMRQLVQRAFQTGGSEVSGDLESRLNASKGGGSALAPEVRAFMEPRFGADFSAVRVHTGGESVQMNRELRAQAFTHGSDVFFGAGKSPGNNELTAHELTHVVQQTGMVQRQATKQATSCRQTPVSHVISFIRREMIQNQAGPDVRFIRHKLAYTISDSIFTPKQSIDLVLACERWYDLVRTKGVWDHKNKIFTKYGEWSADQSNRRLYNFDIWSNIHYGYVGLAANFSEWVLLAGAGIAQKLANTVPPGYWRRRLQRIGDADVLAALDDPHDQEAINIGFALWRSAGRSVSDQNILDAVRSNAARLKTKRC